MKLHFAVLRLKMPHHSAQPRTYQAIWMNVNFTNWALNFSIERSPKTMPNTHGLLDINQHFTLIFVDKTAAKHLPPPDDEENVLDYKV